MGYIGNLSIEDILKSVLMATLKSSNNCSLRDAYHKVLDGRSSAGLADAEWNEPASCCSSHINVLPGWAVFSTSHKNVNISKSLNNKME